ASMLAVLLLPACREVASDGSGGSEPVKVEPIEGTDLARVILTARGAERVGIETAPVESAGDRTTVPEAAVFFDVNGEEWVYTNPEPLTFVREAISVDRFEGDVAVLSDGPSAGTEVVTVGVAELIGSEFGV
ncbi:MAG: hypothetical protein ACT4PO_13065, partial [Actinomycetota bacterium]